MFARADVFDPGERDHPAAGAPWLEITFVQSYLSELQKVKDGWVDECVHPFVDSCVGNSRQ